MGSLGEFNEAAFKIRLNKALERVKTIIGQTKVPQFAEEVQHEYEDKYLLAEYLTNSALAGELYCLDMLGLNEKNLKVLKEWAGSRSVTLRFRAEETCTFLRKTTRDVEQPTALVTKSSLFGEKKEYVVTKVTEYFWSFVVKWDLCAFKGTELDKAIILLNRTGTTEVKTSTESFPYPSSLVRPFLDVNITWLLNLINEEQKFKFTINRTSKDCHTPRRNPEIEDSVQFFKALHVWSLKLNSYFKTLFSVQTDHGLALNSLYDTTLFVPVIPLFDNPEKSDQLEDSNMAIVETSKQSEGSGSHTHSTHSPPRKHGLVPLWLLNDLLQEQRRTVQEKFQELAKMFPAEGKLITLTEAKLVMVLSHAQQLCENYWDGVNYIEELLRKQLIAAIGKEVSPNDLSKYLLFHNRKLFKSEFQPRPFCYAIRRPEHYPEGVLSIEAQLDSGSIDEPIQTTVHWSPATKPMALSINASTQIFFRGDRYLHGWVTHRFSDYSGSNQFSLITRARQFSSFIVLVGRIASADVFEPKFGMIVQNKDEIRIPLLLETIPTPKEFKSAIASLSPEQQRFAKAFRSMQLESTLFGVCVIQIKPQLETLLKLPSDSLTKEIELTQNLLKLFIEYQIPSDLLSFDGDTNERLDNKLANVRNYVTEMLKMIQNSKKSELDQAQQEQKYRLAQNERRVYSASRFGGDLFCESDDYALCSEELKPETTATMNMERSPSSESKSNENEPVESTMEPMDDERTDESTVVDYTKIPQAMEKKFEELDEDGTLRPTIINTGQQWTKKSQKSLLATASTNTFSRDEQQQEKNKAFDLLDALTKSGALTIEQASLHVIIAATHCFDETLVNTIIQKNVNPIEKLERSSLIVSSSIHQVPASNLISTTNIARIANHSPKLLTPN